MPAEDRTTIWAAIEEFTRKLRDNLTANPPTSTSPFLRVEVGAGEPAEFARPFLALRLGRVRPAGATDGDKLFFVTMTMILQADVTASDAHRSLLDKIGAVEDYLDGIVNTGVINGADGFDDREWSIAYPRQTSGARLASAVAEQSFVVRVARGQNR